MFIYVANSLLVLVYLYTRAYLFFTYLPMFNCVYLFTYVPSSLTIFTTVYSWLYMFKMVYSFLLTYV